MTGTRFSSSPEYFESKNDDDEGEHEEDKGSYPRPYTQTNRSYRCPYTQTNQEEDEHEDEER